VGRATRTQWVADFETTTRADDCRVWGWGLARIDTAETAWDVEMGQDIEGFLERCAKMPAIIWFHNLRFDGMFIMYYLMTAGYSHSTERYPGRGQFGTFISNDGAFYTISVCWPNGRRTEFRDSAKKFPNMGVKAVAKTFNLDVQKGEIDYHTPRPVGHELTREEKAYLANDVLIVAKALRNQFAEGMTKLTVGSDALHEYKTIIGTRLFDKMFPVLPETMDAEIRAAYRGGFTYADERFRGKITGPGIVYDVNSLYPSVMYHKLLPYGEPVFYNGLPKVTKEYPLFIVSITFTAKLKKDHIPCIQVKGSSRFTATEYQSVIAEPVTLTCSSVDLALWEDHYDLDILSYNGGWSFHGVQGVFNEFIEKWSKIKAESAGGLRFLAKLMLNNLYGKYATNPNVTQKIPVLDDGVVKLVMGEPETKDPIYTAMGVFITAYARDITIRAGQDNYPHFAYADTDSLHLLIAEDPEGLEVDPNKLGAWKREYYFESALFVRAKTYTEKLFEAGKTEWNAKGHTAGECARQDGASHAACFHVTHIAGLPTRVGDTMTFDDFTGGRKFTGKLVPLRVPGGVVLQDVGFTMPDIT
jgi:hypothetical protein